MKLKRILQYTLAASLLSGVYGCNDYLDINQSPNLPEEVSPQSLLASGIAGAAFANANELTRFTSVLMDYLAGAAGSPATYDVYTTNGADFGNQWRFEIYGGALITNQKMIETADEAGAKAYSGIGKIMNAYTFGLATDVWGDVPYSEALKGDAGVAQPRVDSQADIYKGNAALGIQSLFDLMREGIADLDAPSTLQPGTDDIVYGGNLTNWKRAGNTLMMKHALQMSRREPQLAAAIINEALTRPYINDNAQNLAVKFGPVVNSQSPIYNYTYVSLFRDDLIVSTRYVERLRALNDPRLRRFVTFPLDKVDPVNVPDSVRTIDNGFSGTRPQPSSTWSRWSPTLLGENGVGPVRLLTNAQRAFILAEAALTLPGLTIPATQAQALYAEGIRASMLDAGVTPAEINAYFAANPTVVTLSGTTEEQVEQIINQKYIAQTGNPLETWNDWRRTGYPNLPEHQNAVGINGTRPLRAQYIDQEIARNPNFEVQLPNVPVWWDVD